MCAVRVGRHTAEAPTLPVTGELMLAKGLSNTVILVTLQLHVGNLLSTRKFTEEEIAINKENVL